MRLTATEVEAIRSCARQVFGEACVVRLFGSRMDEARRGGDIDLHVMTVPQTATLPHEIAFRLRLQEAIGEQRIDVVLQPFAAVPRPIDAVALRTGIVLT